MKEIKRIKELTKLLNQYRDDYYNRSSPSVTDHEYDALFDELKYLEEKTGFLSSNSPTQTVGYPVQGKLKKVKHEYPMLSLAKTKSEEALVEFVGEKDALMMFKLDGLTVCCTYENGCLVRAETRGDGIEGEDITENAKVFSNLPLTIPYKKKLVVFGEAIIDYNTFERINEDLPDGEKYKNPRNLCSGSVRQLDSKICAERNVKFVAWRLVEGSESNSFKHRLLELMDHGFDIVPHINFQVDSLQDRIVEGKKSAEKMGFPIDGLVVSFDNIEYGLSLGATGHHIRMQIAFKYEEEKETSILRDIEWSMGKTGVLTPVAIFDPVELAGTTVSRASLHNISIMDELNIGIGGEITVIKANEIIPQIVECSSDSIGFNIPHICPVCGGGTLITKDNSTEILVCTNNLCKGKLLGKMKHFVSKNAMNIDGLSEATIDKFMELGWLNSLSDIFKLDEHYNEISKLNGFGKKSADNLIAAIEKSKNTKLERYLYSLSIPLIGRTASKLISKKFAGDYSEFIAALDNQFYFTTLDDFGHTMHCSLYSWYELYKDSQDAEIPTMLKFETVISDSSNEKLDGIVFVITGSLNHFSNRDEAKEKIESLGGKVVGSVSTKTNFLVNNDVLSTSGKNKKAKGLGVPIVSEDTLLEMIL